MIRLLERGFKLTTGIAWITSAMLVTATAITWLAARDTITFLAPIIVYTLVGCAILAGAVATLAFIVERSDWLRSRRAELRRDRSLARLESDRAIMHLRAEGRLLAATVRQVERGYIHPSTLNDAKFSAFPAAIARQIDQATTPLLEAASRKLPARVDLNQLMNDRPSLNNLILGVTYDDQIVTESLKSLTHIAVAGVTRFGKSIFTQMLLYQIALSKENVELYLADLGGTTFVDFGLPYASTLAETEAMIYNVMSEAERRKELYEATGRGIRSLDIYNEVTGNQLPWIVMIIDEALYLMEKSKAVKENLEIAVSWAAKYGITAVIVSQDWKSNVIATSTRNNFSSRFQFMAEDRTQANILVKDCEAHRIENKGRCFARLPGQNKITEIQTPYISEAQIAAIAPLANKVAPPLTFVVAEPKPAGPSNEEATIIEAVKQVELDHGRIIWSQVTSRLGWTATGPNNQRIKAILDKWQINY
jgi:hypothetical protein